MFHQMNLCIGVVVKQFGDNINVSCRYFQALPYKACLRAISATVCHKVLYRKITSDKAQGVAFDEMGWSMFMFIVHDHR